MLERAKLLKCMHNPRQGCIARQSNLALLLVLENAENSAMIQQSYAAVFVRRSDAFGR